MRTSALCRIAGSIALTLLLAACGSSVEFVRTDPTIYPPKPKNTQIEVYQSEVLRPHVVIGMLTAGEKMEARLGALSTYDRVLHELKKKAREVGADALVEVKPVHETDGMVEAEVLLSAKAVRYLERSRSVTARQR